MISFLLLAVTFLLSSIIVTGTVLEKVSLIDALPKPLLLSPSPLKVNDVANVASQSIYKYSSSILGLLNDQESLPLPTLHQLIVEFFEYIVLGPFETTTIIDEFFLTLSFLLRRITFPSSISSLYSYSNLGIKLSFLSISVAVKESVLVKFGTSTYLELIIKNVIIQSK